MRIPAHVDESGRVIPNDARAVLRYVGRNVWVSIHTAAAPGLRSGQANRFLWAIYAEICRETGNDPESVHWGLKREAVRLGILDPEYITVGDQLLEVDPTTRTDPDTFSRYVDWVRSWALDNLKLVIPEAGE
jgi:hypothetical protein